jgi:Ni/Fe-hydrogenase subunit HybB-like protein
MASHFESPLREPLINGNKTYKDITKISLDQQQVKYNLNGCFGLLFLQQLPVYLFCITWEVCFGIGTWGANKTVGWAWDITNFVWWIGIGHAGTLISAILLLFRQKWRTGVNRAAEAMTIFAVICAGQFPIFHMGRVWDAFFIFPYPNTRGPLWVNFTSPLLWDVFAISTYFTVSLLFWYTGLVPDFATIRDQSKTKGRWNFITF